MNDSTLKLKWDQFETNTPNTFGKLWNDQDFADVTLATVDDCQIKAHKVILSSCSGFFRNIFLKNPHQNPLLYLKGIRYKELVMLMQFIYLGQCEVEHSELQDFLATGNDLQVGGLMEDVNFKDIEEPVVENETHNTQEPHGSDSNYADVCDPTQRKSHGKFNCNECNYVFGTNNGLLYHKRAKHEGVRYECDQCEYKATQPSLLTIHKESKHDGVRNVCDLCDGSFTNNSSLNRHVQSKHEGVKYECDQCDHKATHMHHLTIHKRSQHEGVRYDCSQCDSIFADKSYLAKHKKSKHHRVRYDCNQCDTIFTDKFYLAKHKQLKHE